MLDDFVIESSIFFRGLERLNGQDVFGSKINVERYWGEVRSTNPSPGVDQAVRWKEPTARNAQQDRRIQPAMNPTVRPTNLRKAASSSTPSLGTNNISFKPPQPLMEIQTQPPSFADKVVSILMDTPLHWLTINRCVI